MSSDKKINLLDIDATRWPHWRSDDGNVLLINADCLEVLPTLPKGCVDSVTTDPPYLIANDFGEQRRLDGKRKLPCAGDSNLTQSQVVEAVEMAIDAITPRGSITCWCGSDQVELHQRAMRSRGFTPKMMAWVKKCPPPAMPGNWWPSGFELGLYAYRSGAWFGDTDKKRRNVWVHDSYRHGKPGKVDHPTQKPLALIARLVAATVPHAGLSLDPFMGSGTTGVACVRLGRQFIGIELEPRYYEIAIKRIKAEIERFPLFEQAGKPVTKTLPGFGEGE